MKHPRVLRVAVCAFLTMGTAGQALAESIFVDQGFQSGSEDGSRNAPYRTITQALKEARRLRYGAGDLAPSPRKIIVHVAAGTYVGSFNAAVFDPATASYDPSKEELPLLLNVSGIELRGATQLTDDAGGLPVAVVDGTATTLRADVRPGPQQYLVLITRTFARSDSGFPEGLAMAGDGTTVSGFVVDGRGLDGLRAANPSVGIAVDRVGEFVVHRNYITNASNGVWTSQASGRIDGNLVLQNTTNGIAVGGGSRVYPADVRVSGNRVNRNANLGLGLTGAGETEDFGGVGRRSLDLGVNKFTRVPIPVFDRSVNPDEIPEKLFVRVVGNEFNDHTLSGVRAASYFAFPYQTANGSQEQRSEITAIFTNNVCQSNARHGIVADAGFPRKENPRKWTGMMNLTFDGNALDGNGWAPVMLDLWRYQDSMNEALGTPNPANFRYLHDSTYEVSGDLDDFDYNNRSVDPIDGTATNNVFRVNGVERGGATGVGPEICILNCRP